MHKEKNINATSPDKQAKDWIIRLANTPLENGNTLKESFSHGNYSFWWSLDYAITCGLPYYEILSLYFLNLKRGIIKKQQKKKGKFLLFLKRVRMLSRFFIWQCFKFFSQKKIPRHPIVLFPTRDYLYFDKSSKRTKISDCFQPIVQEMNHRENILYVEYPLEYRLDLFKMVKGFFKKGPFHVPFEHYVTFSSLSTSIREHRQYVKQWKLITSSKKFKELSIFEGYDLYPHLIGEFDFFVQDYLLDAIIEFHAFENMMIQKPISYSMFGEASSLGRMAASCARAVHVPSIGIQHGIIGDFYHYTLSQVNISNTQENNPHYCPLMDVTCLYGDFYRKWLMEFAHYSRDWLTVTGDSRSDVIYSIQQTFDREQICKYLHINAGKRIVVFATRSISYSDERNEILNIFSACSQLFNIHLIIKVHPRRLHYSLYLDIAHEVGFSNLTVIRDFDIYQPLFICDHLISSGSTTLLESLLMGKPVVLLNSSLHLDIGWLTNSNLIPKARTDEEISKALNLPLNRMEYGKFISDYYYHIDGKSSQRIASVIEQQSKHLK